MSEKPTPRQANFSMASMTKVLIVVFALNLIVERIAQLSQITNAGTNTDWQTIFLLSLKLPNFWTGLLVPVCYLFSLWSAAKFLAVFETGQGVSQQLLRELQNLGANLMYAGFASLLIAPTLESWINQGGRSFRFNFEINAVVIGMVGMILKLVARRLLEKMEEPSTPQA